MYLLHRSVGPSVQFLYSGCMIAAKFRIMTIEQRAVRGTAENFVICDTQKSYSENLFRRLSEKLSGYFQFHVFHDIENLKIAAKSMQVNILLIGEEYGKEDRDEIPARQKYLLIGEKIPNERSPTEIPFFRYQSVSSMLELLLQEKNQENSEVQTHQIQLVSDRSQTVKANVNGLIGIYSPVHRIGKTRFAMRMGRVLSESIPTLYLNLEGYSGLNYYLPEESGMNLGDLLYYMKQESINPVWKISTLISHMNGLDYIAPIRAEQDFREVTKEEWNQLLDLILEKSIYKVIILDLGDTVDGLYDLLGRCSKVYTPYIEEGAANNDGSFCSETFIYRNKVLQTFTMTLTWEKGEQAEISNGTANNIAEIKYTSKGYLIYSYEYIVAHAALKEYYRVKPLSDTLRILTDQYVSVFNYLNYNFLTQNWDESNVETILLPRLFEDLYQVHTGEQLKKDSGRISAEIYENVMIACLPVTIEELRKHCGYDMESNTYDSGTFFYRGTSPFGEVVDYLDNSDGTLTLYVDAVWPDRNTDCAFKNEIVIKPYGDGTCQYLSNKVQKIELDIPVYEEY